MPRHLAPLCVAIALAVGIACASAADELAVSVVLRWLLAIAAAAIAVRRPSFVLAAALFGGLALGSHDRRRAVSIDTTDDRRVDQVTGRVEGPPLETAHGFGSLLVGDRGDRVWVWTRERLEAGQRVVVEGVARSARPSSGPALPDRADALRVRDADVELTARSVQRLGDEPLLVDDVWRWAGRQQRAWAEHIARASDRDPAARAALAGIVVGVRRDIPPALDERWRRSGIYHVLSVSGLHLAVVAGLVFWLARRLVAASPWGQRSSPARWAAPPAFAIALAYTLVTGAQVATVRALVVVAIVLVAAMLDRPVRLIDALGVAAIALLAWRPAELFDPGFQLSFTATLALAVTARPTEQRGVLGWVRRGLAASLWIAIATAPITAYHFQHVMPSGIVGNLVLGPLLELAALPLALAGLALGWDAPIALAAWVVEVVDGGAAMFADHAIVGRVALVGPTLLAALVALSLVLAARARRTRVDFALWLALCVGWAAGRTPPPAGALRVTFVDVGQGDAAIVELPDGAVWLVDAGGHAGARDPGAPGRAIDRVLAAYGHDRIALAMVSHPHPDHYAGLAGMTTPVDELWLAPEPEPTVEHARFAHATAALRRGQPTSLVRGDVALIAWWPRYDGHGIAADPVRGVNDNSLVVELRYRGRSILFTGDLEEEGEAALVATPGFGAVDVVKVPHHGSRTSSSAAFVAATRPALAVISCGVANAFDFPAPEVVARWQRAGATVLSTDRHGSITITIDAVGDLDIATALDRELRSLP